MARIGADLSGIQDEDMHRGGGGWEVMPDGWYRFIVFQSDYKPTAAKDGMCLHLQLKCLDVGWQGEERRDFLTLEHPKQKTVQIAKARLKEIAVAVGYPDPNFVLNSEDLHNIPMMVRIYTEKEPNRSYADVNGMRNRIGEYLGCDEWEQKHGSTEQSPPLPSLPSGVDEPPVPSDGDEVPF